MRAFHPEKIPLPPDFRSLSFDPNKPLDIEIGCGVGFHPLHYARANPERQIIAFERTSEKFEKFLGRIKNHPALPNLIPIHGDAIAWIVHGIAPESVSQYFILYPNPYPKESQRNLRFYAMPAFVALLKTLKPRGKLILATNEKFYADDAEEIFVREWKMKLESRQNYNETPRTHFEKKYMARGEKCWNLIFEKN